MVWRDGHTGEFVFCDFPTETPKGRVNLCCNRAARDSRKEHKPENNAVDIAAAMGVELLTEQEYFALQKLGGFDGKTSSWLKTPDDICKQGGAIFGGGVRI